MSLWNTIKNYKVSAVLVATSIMWAISGYNFFNRAAPGFTRAADMEINANNRGPMKSAAEGYRKLGIISYGASGFCLLGGGIEAYFKRKKRKNDLEDRMKNED